MSQEGLIVIYWDASAILSALIQDSHSDKAQNWANHSGAHLLSTLAYSEVLTVLARMKKERIIADILAEAAMEVLDNGPWRRINLSPDWKIILALSKKFPLRGADLWHLAIAKSIQKQIPELQFLTFDSRLQFASQREGLST